MKDEAKCEAVGDDDEGGSKKISMKRKIPANHVSADDMEFDDIEYVESRNRDKIKKTVAEERAAEELAAKEEKKQKKKQEEEEDNNDDEEDEDEDENDDESESDAENGTGEDDDEAWLGKFESLCEKRDKRAVDCVKFEKSLRALIEVDLDPSRAEGNKQRLARLTERLVDYYRAAPFDGGRIDVPLVELLTRVVYELTSKWGNKSTKKEPSPFVAVFKQLLVKLDKEFTKAIRANQRHMPPLSTVIRNFEFSFFKIRI